MTKSVGEQLLELKARSGLALSEIARLAGYRGASSLQRYFSKSYDPEALDYRTALKLSEAMDGAGDPPIEQYDLMKLTAIKDSSGSRPDLIPVQPSKEIKSFIPIYNSVPTVYAINVPGSISAVDAIIIEYDSPVEHLRCPPVLERRDVFGFYVPGISMQPRFEVGETVFTEGRKPASVGDDVVVVLKDAQDNNQVDLVILGRLLEIEGKSLTLKHFFGDSFPVLLSEIHTVRRVMSSWELLPGFII